jgi:GNAT superfamily N-acetyltransferase
MEDIRIEGYIPGALGSLTRLHAIYYHRTWNFGRHFELKVGGEMAAFLQRYDADRDGFWIACQEDRIVGGIAIDGFEAARKGAHLRWFIVDPNCQGRGVGNRLLRTAIEFCRQRRYERIYLWTFAGLESARHLYEKFGFELCREVDDDQWGVRVRGQRFEHRLRERK